MIDLEELLTADELAEHLKVPVSTVHTWRYRSTGPRSVKVGRHIRYPKAAVVEWLGEQDLG